VHAGGGSLGGVGGPEASDSEVASRESAASVLPCAFPGSRRSSWHWDWHRHWHTAVPLVAYRSALSSSSASHASAPPLACRHVLREALRSVHPRRRTQRVADSPHSSRLPDSCCMRSVYMALARSSRAQAVQRLLPFSQLPPRQ